eukprot:TRINITY_DN70082_c0_g1_i1.p1 TRINITY_DN70082_c0_g1~~TRINITY_DN70082_c0_g1_i1.p1  ORF type:complete len:383 (-),score=69.57 TRINITY_DN70082_c0_g1_i1:125-1273(-)
MRKVTIFGAGGFVGSAISNAFLQKGIFSLNCSGRTQAGMLGLMRLPRAPELISTFIHDVKHPETLHTAVRDSEVVVYCASPGDSYLFRPHAQRMPTAAATVHHAVKGVEAVVEAAKQSSAVKRLILISSLAAIIDHEAPGPVQFDDRRMTPTAERYLAHDSYFWDTAEHHPFSTSKAAAEAVFWQAAESVLADRCVCIAIRPGLCLGPLYNPLREAPMAVQLVQDVVGGKPCHLQIPLTRLEDVAQAVVRCAMMPHAVGPYVVASKSTVRAVPDFARVLRQHDDRYVHLCDRLLSQLPDQMEYSIPGGSCDISRTERDLLLDPDATIEEALLPHVESMLEHGFLPDPHVPLPRGYCAATAPPGREVSSLRALRVRGSVEDAL